jgi:uncharacterized protein YcbX
MIIDQLWIYPVKSCRGILQTSLELGLRGAKYDREWMVVDQAGKFTTQRTHPILATVTTALDANFLYLTCEGLSCKIPLHVNKIVTRRVQVWKDHLDAVDQGPEAEQFFSPLLGGPHYLVRHPGSNARKWQQDDNTGALSFADSKPFLIVGTASLTALNELLTIPINIQRFRANIILQTTIPFVEDGWKNISIGGVSFFVTGQCARCVVINVDQTTGVLTGSEPLKSLALSRRQGNKVPFGILATVDVLDVITAGQSYEAF